MIPDARPAIVVANWRCGGTFLNYCLSSHPEIFCDRGEPMHRQSPWRKAMPGDPTRLLYCVLTQRHYTVAMCKLTYTQAFAPTVWPFLLELKPAVISLRRENVLRQAVSLILVKRLNKGQEGGTAIHTQQDVPPAGVALEPDVVLSHARALAQADKDARERLERQFPGYLALTYADVVGGEGTSADRLPTATARRICAHLSVPYRAMTANLRRVNAYPLREIVANWPEVERAVAETELAHLLADEALWT